MTVPPESKRLRRFERIAEQLEKLISAVPNPVTQRATAAALLHHKVPRVSWTGFYLRQGDKLVVDAYQGPVACLVLPAHTGVCWAALDQERGLVVEDVERFPGHIACDGRSRSELVVPLRAADGAVIGVLDVDSYEPARFDETDLAGYTLVVSVLERAVEV